MKQICFIVFILSAIAVNCAKTFNNVSVILTTSYTSEAKIINLDQSHFTTFEYPKEEVLIESGDNLKYYVNLTNPMREKIKILNQTIPELPENSVSDLKELQDLEIDNCGIEVIRAGAFKNLSELEYLIITNNLINDIKKGVFNNLISLQTLDLSHNQIRTIAEEAFNNMKMQRLNIAYNKISVWNGNSWFKGTQLGAISLSHNQIRELPPNSFEFYQQFRDKHSDVISGYSVSYWYIELDYNELEIVHPGAFSGLEQLGYLNLSNNRIEKLEDKTFDGVFDLNNLEIGNNKLKEFPKSLFKHMELAYIQMENNQLSCIPIEIVKTRISQITVDGNPFSCKCVEMWENWKIVHNNTNIIDFAHVNCTRF